MNVKKLLFFYFVFFLIFSVVFIALFHTPLFAELDVLFYRGLNLLAVTVISMVSLLFVFRKRLKSIGLESKTAALSLALSIHLVLFIVFPVTVDRSVTIFLLEDLRKNAQIASCTGLSDDTLRGHFVDTYVFTQDAIGRRMHEQELTGFVKGSKDCRSLTPEARQFLLFSDIVSRIYGVRSL